MPKLTLSDVNNLGGNPVSAQQVINTNSDRIEAAVEKTLSRDGTSPNQMEADFDMNHYDILNVAEIHGDKLFIDGVQIEGAAAWISGSGAPSDSSGKSGDFYLNELTGDVYGPKQGTWGGPVANIKGPQGTQGFQGPQGVQGPQGIQGVTGPQGTQGPQGVQGTQGAKGDSFSPDAVGLATDRSLYDGQPAGFSFLDTENGYLYFKKSNASGDWTSGVPFTAGPQGPVGPQGIQGPDGLQGVDGPQGVQGPAGVGVPSGGNSGQILTKNTSTDYDTSWQNVSIPLDVNIASRSAIAVTTIPMTISYLRTAGYSAAGDGGEALYKRVASEPTHAGKVQSADGAWWEIVPDFGVNLLQFGAKADGLNLIPTDNRQMIQDAINYCINTGKASQVRIPKGSFYFAGTLFIDLPDKTSKIDYRSVDFVGEGNHTSELITDTALTDAAIMLRGPSDMGNLNLGGVQDLHWRDFRARPKNGGVGDFLFAKGIGHSKFESVLTFEFRRHYQITDTLVFTFDRCRMSWGRWGVWFYRNSFTYPNVIVFLNTTLGGLADIGGLFEGAAGVIFVGGSVEGNGTSGDDATGGIRFGSGGNEGGVGLELRGTYFEYNKGGYDIEINANSNASFGQIHNIAGVFNRGGTTGNATNNIRVNTDAGYAPVKVDYSGSAFVGFPGYTPSATRKNVQVNGGGPVITGGNALFDNAVEAPYIRGSTPHAAVRFNASATVSERMNISSVVKNAAGQFTINFGSEAIGGPPSVQVTNMGGDVLIPMIWGLNSNLLTIRFVNLAGVLTDPAGVIDVRIVT